MKCVKCNSPRIAFNGRYLNGIQRYKCNDCGKQFSEATFRKFYRHRFPAQIITIAIFFHFFIPARIVQIFIFFLFRCYVSKNTICEWTKKTLEDMPELKFVRDKCNLLIRHTDEKQIKIKRKKAWWWNSTDHAGNPLNSCISRTRHGFVAFNFMRKHKKLYGSPLIMITDKLQAYIKSVKKLGKKCKHITRGIKEEVEYFGGKSKPLLLSNLQVERFHSKIDAYINMKFRGSFESLESADRWRKAFMFITYLQEMFALQKSFGTFFTVSDRHTKLRELTVSV